MHDINKRKTLKTLGGVAVGGVVMGVPLASAASAPVAMVDQLEADHLPEIKLSDNAPRLSTELQIQLISSAGVPEDTLILKNTTDEVLYINTFLPDVVYVKNRHLNLDTLLADGPLTIAPGSYLSVPVKLDAMTDEINIAYVWADHAVDNVTPELSVTSLGAFMADHRAVVFTMPSVHPIPA